MPQPPPNPELPTLGRWLIFLPALILFILAGSLPLDSADSNALINLHNEVLGFAFIAVFIALLWVSSTRMRVPKKQSPPAPPRSRGFEVMPPR